MVHWGAGVHATADMGAESTSQGLLADGSASSVLRLVTEHTT